MIAAALSPKARALIQAHRDAHRPTAADRDRVAAALRERLGVAVLPLNASSQPRAGWTAWQRRSATALGVGAVASVLFFARRPGTAMEVASPPSPLQSRPLDAQLSANSPAPTEKPSSASEPTVPPRAKLAAPLKPRSAPSSRGGTTPAQDSLAQEVRLLSRATSQLNSGQAGLALATLDEHQRQFSQGVLSDERNAAKARALCSLQRFAEATSTLALLTPGTPLAARVKEDCDAASSRTVLSGSSRNTAAD